jgi:DNA repair protein RadD
MKAEANHYATASYAPIISDEIYEDIKVFRVDNVYYAKHDKEFKTPSLRVTYQCGRKAFREWVCVEHTSGIRKKAESWWRKRSDVECPQTVDEALRLADTLRPARFVTVSMSGKYPEILNHELD